MADGHLTNEEEVLDMDDFYASQDFAIDSYYESGNGFQGKRAFGLF